MKTIMLMLISLLSLLLSGCSALDQFTTARPEMTLTNVQFGAIDLQQATLLFDVEIDNPYTVALPLLNLSYTLSSRQNPLFSGTADIQTTIPAQQKKTITLPVSLGYMDVVNAFKDLKDVRPGSTIPYEAAVTIAADAPVLGTLRVPIQRNGDLTVPTLQDVESWKNIFNAIDSIRSL